MLQSMEPGSSFSMKENPKEKKSSSGFPKFSQYYVPIYILSGVVQNFGSLDLAINFLLHIMAGL